MDDFEIPSSDSKMRIKFNTSLLQNTGKYCQKLFIASPSFARVTMDKVFFYLLSSVGETFK